MSVVNYSSHSGKRNRLLRRFAAANDDLGLTIFIGYRHQSSLYKQIVVCRRRSEGQTDFLSTDGFMTTDKNGSTSVRRIPIDRKSIRRQSFQIVDSDD